MIVFPSSSEMTSLYIGLDDPTLPRAEGLNSNNDGTEQGKGVNVQLLTATFWRDAHLAHMVRNPFPNRNEVTRGSGPSRPRLRSSATCSAAFIAALYVLFVQCGPGSWPGGVHAIFGWSEEGVRVVNVPANGPAHTAGLHENDRVVAIDGVPVAGLSEEQVQKKLTGEVGTIAVLSVLRDGEPLEIKIERAPYKPAKPAFP